MDAWKCALKKCEQYISADVIFCVWGQYYTIIDFNEVDIRIYLPEKVIIH